MFAKKVRVTIGPGNVWKKLCRCLAIMQMVFKIIDLKINNQFSEKYKIADVREIASLKEIIILRVCSRVKWRHPFLIQKLFKQSKFI